MTEHREAPAGAMKLSDAMAVLAQAAAAGIANLAPAGPERGLAVIHYVVDLLLQVPDTGMDKRSMVGVIGDAVSLAEPNVAAVVRRKGAKG